MNTISKEFSILPGVMGSCVFDRIKGILFPAMPDFFTDLMAQEASNNIGRMIQMAEHKGLEPQTMSIRYNKFILLARPIDSNATLLILCEPSSNTSLVTTTANMLSYEIRKFLEQTSKNSEVDAHTDQQTTQALDTIKKALFDTVGPIADMVYDECIERWTTTNPPDVSRILELVGCLSMEIDNPEMFGKFKRRISDLL